MAPCNTPAGLLRRRSAGLVEEILDVSRRRVMVLLLLLLMLLISEMPAPINGTSCQPVTAVVF